MAHASRDHEGDGRRDATAHDGLLQRRSSPVPAIVRLELGTRQGPGMRLSGATT
jgi:hypothetical protein